MIDPLEPHILASLTAAREALDKLLENQTTIGKIAEAGILLVETFRKGCRVFACGNGGSMADAMHFAEELTGRYREDRPALPAIAIADPTHLSCVGNDYGYEQVFSRYLQAHAKAGDVLLAISTSGASNNVLQAATAARVLGMKIIALSGRPNSALEAQADITICTEAGRYADRVQELHIKVLHILIELVERELFQEKLEQ